MAPVFDFLKPIAIGSDHAGFAYKQTIVAQLKLKGIAVLDKGAYSTDAVDYPDVAHPVAKAVETGEATCGILLCGAANGMAITANKHAGIRAAICWTANVALLARQHNNANVLCLPARFISEPDALDIVTVFLTASFEGGRHAVRVRKIG